jgi:hypothetical protein
VHGRIELRCFKLLLQIVLVSLFQSVVMVVLRYCAAGVVQVVLYVNGRIIVAAVVAELG